MSFGPITKWAVQPAVCSGVVSGDSRLSTRERLTASAAEGGVSRCCCNECLGAKLSTDGSEGVVKTWVQTLGAEWEAAYGGVAPYKQLGRYCKPLLAKYPFSQVQIHLRHYLAAHHDREARFAIP